MAIALAHEASVLGEWQRSCGKGLGVARRRHGGQVSPLRLIGTLPA